MLRKLNLFVVILAISVLIYGSYHYKGRVNRISAKTTETTDNIKEVEQKIKTSQYQLLSKNLPKKIVTLLKEKKHVNLLIVQEDKQHNNDYSSLLKERLNDNYGDGIWSVSVLSYEDQTSKDLIEGDFAKQVNGKKADMILFEVPLMNDNGVVRSEDSIANLQKVIDKIGKTSVVVVQPNEPIYQSEFYPKEVAAFKKAIEKRDITYLDNWNAWPDYKTQAFTEYVGENKNLNEKGQELWGNYLSQYFIAN
ncbi:hypothetical protein [Gottfriedia acidiceleris]|uniref:hypothetical protein n=1 Tax=Gottfriedia acidiceleris TaxID=371036 RepID=UPI003D1DCBE1